MDETQVNELRDALEKIRPLIEGKADYLGIYKDGCKEVCRVLGWGFGENENAEV